MPLLRGLQARLTNLDTEVLRRVAGLPRTPADSALSRLSGLADHSVLWICLAGVLALRKGRSRRAGLRGLAAIAGSSALANALGKPLFPRHRPIRDALPVWRRLTAPPTSPAFPSGHSASAAAFATAVAMEFPAAGAVVAPLAATVAYSRVHTGAHWPSDVLGGIALGSGVAFATRRWWPLRPPVAAQARRCRDAPALREGEGLVVVVNKHAGDPGEDPADRIRQMLPAARVLEPDPEVDLAELLDCGCRDAVAIGVVGGDGTVAAAAGIAHRRGLPLAVVPEGTLNHFARDVGIGELAQATEAVGTGTAVSVDLGTIAVDGPKGASTRCFVNTASLGGYPDLVRLRERWERRWGKWPAAAAAMVRVLAEARPLPVEIDGRRQMLWVLFVGNGIYHPVGLAPAWRPRLDRGLLDVRYLRADVRFSRARFLVAAVTGTLARSRVYVQRETPALQVRVLGEPVALATDGELGLTGGRFRFAVAAPPLAVYRPPD